MGLVVFDIIRMIALNRRKAENRDLGCELSSERVKPGEKFYGVVPEVLPRARKRENGERQQRSVYMCSTPDRE